MERRHSPSDIAKTLRADIPATDADDLFIARLARLAASSAPTSDGARVRRATPGVRIAAVAASVALITAGGTYAVQTFGGDNVAPAPANETGDPARPPDGMESGEDDADEHDSGQIEERVPEHGDGPDGRVDGDDDPQNDTAPDGQADVDPPAEDTADQPADGGDAADVDPPAEDTADQPADGGDVGDVDPPDHDPSGSNR